MKAKTTPTALIAPCGMNCRLCLAYQREKNVCPGCRGDDARKMKSCLACRIKTCDRIAQGGARYCFGCPTFPCARLKQLDQRYRARYGMSMIENLQTIERLGVRAFIKHQKERWTCPGCGGLLCVHRPVCLSCGRTRG